MTNLKLILGAAACALPLVLFAAPASAITAHNYQRGTHTTNNNSDRGSVMMRRHHMRPMMKHRMKRHMRRM